MGQNARIAALAGVWGAVLIIGIAGAATSPTETPPTAEAIATDEPTPEPTVADESGCADFRTQEEAQDFYIGSGGPDEDSYGLDADKNGVACESLPTATPEPTPTLEPTEQPVIAAPAPQQQVAPAPEPAPQPPAQAPAQNCHPSYEGACLDPNSEDYDCAGGSGNGPDYTGPVRVVGPDEYDLDRDGNGYGCESS